MIDVFTLCVVHVNRAPTLKLQNVRILILTGTRIFSTILIVCNRFLKMSFRYVLTPYTYFLYVYTSIRIYLITSICECTPSQNDMTYYELRTF